MRSFLLGLLLATTATPTLAQSDAEARQSLREAREAARAERGQNSEREAPRVRAPAAGLRAPAMERPEGDAPRARLERLGHRSDSPASVEPGLAPREDRPRPRLLRRPEIAAPDADSVANWRRDRREALRERDPAQVLRESSLTRVRPPREARPYRPAPPPATVGVASHPTPRWTSGWRGDRRYDWRRHRDRHRSLFRIGLYYDPFGWNYRRLGVGWRLWPSYYSRSYWLDDPFTYRLPYAPYPYRWIRYWDDALLVNLHTGQVVDVERNFFW